MKYTILGFNQKKAIEYELKIEDLLVLRWFIDFKGTDKMETIRDENETYFWINYSKLLEDIPILKTTTNKIKARHFDKLCKCKVLKHKHIKEGGSFSYYALGDNYLSLIADYPSSNFGIPLHQNWNTPSSNFGRTNIDLLNNNSIKDRVISTSSIDHNNISIYDFLQENGFILTPIHYEVIQNWEDNDLTRYAIKKAVLNAKYNINYIDKILYNYKRENITTVEQAKAQEDEYQKAKEFREARKNENKMGFLDKVDMWIKEIEEEEKNGKE